MTLFYFVMLMAGALIPSSQVAAESPQVNYMRSFQSERVLFPTEESQYSQPVPGGDSTLLRWFFQDLLSWVPRGKAAFFSERCQPKVWADRIHGRKVRDQGDLIEEYLQKCSFELETGVTHGIPHFLKIMSMELNLEKHPFLHRVVFQLPDGSKLKGKLALKGDLKRRPMIIFRLGVYGMSEEFKPERFIFMMLFDQTPFNVLVLDNTASPEYVTMNSRGALGGYSEGLQNMWIAKLLTDKSEPLSQIVDSIHMVGMSLGGHGVLFSSLLNEFNFRSNSRASSEPNAADEGQRIVNSFFGFCPVVNLKPTVDRLSSPGLFGMGVEFWTRYRLQSLGRLHPSLKAWDWLDWLRFRPTFLRKAIQILEKEFEEKEPSTLGLKLPPSLRVQKSFWSLQNFWPNYQGVRSPVMIWATKQDQVVSLRDNSETISQANIRVVEFPIGHHCTLPIGYDWSALSSLLSASIMAQRNPISMVKESLRLKLPSDYDSMPALWTLESITWVWTQSRGVDLELRHRLLPRQSIHAQIPLDRFDFRFRNSELSEVEKQMLERWLFQNIKVEGRPPSRDLWVSWSRVP